MPFFSSSTTQMIPYQAEFKFGDKAEVTSTTEVWVTIDAAPALFILKNILPPFCVFRFNSFSVFFFSCLLFLFLKVFFFCFYFFLIVCLIDFSRSCDEAIDRLNCFFFLQQRRLRGRQRSYQWRRVGEVSKPISSCHTLWVYCYSNWNPVTGRVVNICNISAVNMTLVEKGVATQLE